MREPLLLAMVPPNLTPIPLLFSLKIRFMIIINDKIYLNSQKRQGPPIRGPFLFGRLFGMITDNLPLKYHSICKRYSLAFIIYIPTEVDLIHVKAEAILIARLIHAGFSGRSFPTVRVKYYFISIKLYDCSIMIYYTC